MNMELNKISPEDPLQDIKAKGNSIREAEKKAAIKVLSLLDEK